jgi:hypothetical protein
MEPEGLLPCSQESANGHYPELLLSSHLRLGFPNNLFPSYSPTKILYTFLIFPCALHARPIFFTLDLIISIISGEEYKLGSSSLCRFLQSPVTSYLLSPNILLSTLFSNTLDLCSSLNVRDQVLHTYKTTGKITVLHIMFLDIVE